MNRDLFVSVVTSILKRFRPFVVELANGTRLEITHPEALTLHERAFMCTSTRGVRSVMEYDVVFRIVDTTT